MTWWLPRPIALALLLATLASPWTHAEALPGLGELLDIPTFEECCRSQGGRPGRSSALFGRILQVSCKLGDDQSYSVAYWAKVRDEDFDQSHQEGPQSAPRFSIHAGEAMCEVVHKVGPVAFGSEVTLYQQACPDRPEYCESEALLRAERYSRVAQNCVPEATPSPILFLPGIGGTELYHQGRVTDAMLWPAAYSGDRQNLALDPTGTGQVPVEARRAIRAVIVERQTPRDTRIYAPFFQGMERRGFVQGRNFFEFPYDWRLDNRIHVARLAKKIDEVLAETGREKLILATHSMGALVARAYLKHHGSEKVAALVCMAPPHLGAPKAYYALIQGYAFGNPLVNSNLMKILVQNLPAAYQIMPRWPFVRQSQGQGWSQARQWDLGTTYQARYRSLTLEDVDWVTTDDYSFSRDFPWQPNPYLVEGAAGFHQWIGHDAPRNLPTYAIIGYQAATLSAYVALEVPPAESTSRVGAVRGPDGKVFRLFPIFTDGDTTVPVESARGLVGDREIFVADRPGDSTRHGVIASSDRVMDILNAIARKAPLPEEVRLDPPTSSVNDDELSFRIECPADLHLRDPEGGHLGFGPHGAEEETLPGGAFLAMGEIQYAAVAAPRGEYRVQVEGRGQGTFTLFVHTRSVGVERDFTYPEVPVAVGTRAELVLPGPTSWTSPPPLRVKTGDRVAEVPARASEGGLPGSPRSEPPPTVPSKAAPVTPVDHPPAAKEFPEGSGFPRLLPSGARVLRQLSQCPENGTLVPGPGAAVPSLKGKGAAYVLNLDGNYYLMTRALRDDFPRTRATIPDRQACRLASDWSGDFLAAATSLHLWLITPDGPRLVTRLRGSGSHPLLSRDGSQLFWTHPREVVLPEGRRATGLYRLPTRLPPAGTAKPELVLGAKALARALDDPSAERISILPGAKAVALSGDGTRAVLAVELAGRAQSPVGHFVVAADLIQGTTRKVAGPLREVSGVSLAENGARLCWAGSDLKESREKESGEKTVKVEVREWQDLSPVWSGAPSIPSGQAPILGGEGRFLWFPEAGYRIDLSRPAGTPGALERLGALPGAEGSFGRGLPHGELAPGGDSLVFQVSTPEGWQVALWGGPFDSSP